MTGRKELRILGIAVMTSLLMVSCGDSSESDQEEETVDTSTTTNPTTETTIGGYRFSIPSPVQTADLLKETGAVFNKDMLNPYDNVSNYSTAYQKALNLGVYGADLGYITIYENDDDALSYLASVDKLYKDIGLEGAIDEALMNRFSDNLENKDSLLMLVAQAQRDANNYLQTEQKYNLIGLVLAGGWIESLHFACQVAQQNSNQEVINRIGDQKRSLENLINLLSEFRNEPLYEDLVLSLEELYQYGFRDLTPVYNYSKPKTLADRKITYITSSTTFDMDQETLDAISEIVAEIRTQITE